MLFDDQPTGGGVFRSTVEGTYSSTTTRLKKKIPDSFRGGKLALIRKVSSYLIYV